MDTVQTIQTKDYIIQAIRKEILSGKMTMGEEITQEEIASQLGVSRMPVREAFQVLEKEGFLLRLQNRHMKVAEMNREHINEIFHMVGIFEVELFCFLNENEKEKFKNELENFCLGAETLTEAEFFNIELSLHQNAVERLDNPYIKPVYISFLEGIVSYAILSFSREKKEVLTQLKEILGALCLKNEEQLREKVLTYYITMADHVLKRMEEVDEH